jgi:hypothetical protein
MLQVLLGSMGAADQLTRGHNGFNSGAYLLAARNSIRFHRLLPHQYHTSPTPPPRREAYTHHPLAMHWHNVASVWLFGDSPASIRGVAAVHAVFAAAALIFVVSRLWSVAHGVVAGAIYVLLPINAIYLNMANHSSGFIGWGLLCLYSYVRLRQEPTRWRFAALLGTFAMAAAWDWPAYYLALIVAIHWAYTSLRNTLETGLPWYRDLGRLTIFSIWVILQVVFFIGICIWATGSIDDLLHTASARQGADTERFLRNVTHVPPMMFTWPILALTAGWLGWWFVRLRRGRALARDVIPLVYAIGGLTHYYVFRSSAVVHSYWLWTTLPFVAIACADCIVSAFRLARRARSRLRAGLMGAFATALAVVSIGALADRTATMTPPARWVGGSMWFVSDVRTSRPEVFDSGRGEIRFAEKVREWTDRTTVVYVDRSLQSRQTEPRFDATLDRTQIPGSWRSNGDPRVPPNHDGAVLIGLIDQLQPGDVARLARGHGFRQWGQFYMIDYRSDAHEVEVYRTGPLPMTWSWRYFHSAYEHDVRASRDRAAERAIREAQAAL